MGSSYEMVQARGRVFVLMRWIYGQKHVLNAKRQRFGGRCFIVHNLVDKKLKFTGDTKDRYFYVEYSPR